MCPRVTSVTVSPRATKGAGPGQPPAHRPAPVPFPPRCWLPTARRRPRLGSAASVPVTGRAAPVSLGSHSTWGSPCGAGRGRGRSGWPSLQKPCAARRPGRAPLQALAHAAYSGRPKPVSGLMGAYQPVQGHMTRTVIRAKAPPSHTTVSSHVFQAALLVEKGDKRVAKASRTSGLQRPGDGSQRTSQGQRDGPLSSRPPRPARSAGGRALTERCPGQRST